MVSQRKQVIIACLLFITLLFSFNTLLAGTTGKISGMIKDKDNNEPLIGVNVVVEGTVLGAATHHNGVFTIINIPPGIYNLKAMMIGYKTVTLENIQVFTDMTSSANFELESSIIEGETVVVQAERPLVQRDETAKTAILDFQVFSEMPIQEVSEAIATQSGFTSDEAGNLHLRGGRSGEIAYMIDGVLVQDPFYKSGAAGVLLDKYLIQELQVMTGAFSAEYGQAMSGVINIVTKEGSLEKYTGRIEYESHWLNESPYRKQDWMLYSDLVSIPTGDENKYRDSQRWYQWNSENPDSLVSTPTEYDPIGTSKYSVPEFESIPGVGKLPSIFGSPLYGYYTANLSGPVPFIKNLSFFASGRYSNYYSHLQFGYNANRDFNIKLSYCLHDIKINASVQRSCRYSKPYDHRWKYTPEGYEDRQDLVDRESLELTHVLGEKTFYTVRLSRYVRGFLRYNPNRKFKISDYPEYIYSNSELLDSLIILESDWKQGSLNAGGYYVSGDHGRYEDNETATYSAKFDMLSQLSHHHEIKTGLEFTYYTVKRDRWIQPWANAPHYIEIFEHNPNELAVYLQDKMEYDRFVLNVGLRFDYLDANHTMWEDIYVAGELDETTGEWTPSKEVAVEPQYHISPRIGIAYPVTDKVVFRSSYGHFYEKPGFYEMYKSHDVVADRHPLVGNSKIKNQKTVQYEFGVKSQIGNNWTFDVNAYYKDITNLAASAYHIGFPYHFTIFDNSDYASVKGIEFTLERKVGRFFTGVLNYSLSVAKGNESSSSDGYNLYRGVDVSERPNREYYLDFDRRHDLSFNSIIKIPRDFGPKFLGFKPFERWNMNLMLELASGLPYTPTLDEGFVDIFIERNTGRKPWFSQVDLRLQRNIQVLDNVEIMPYLVVKNLFNRLNTNYVWTRTGEAWDAGIASSYSKDRQHNPENAGISQQISVGMRVTF